MVWRPDLPEGNAARHIKHHIVQYTRGRVLDLGSGPWKAYPHFISVDNCSGWDWMRWKPDIICDAENLEIFASNSFDAVFSSHLLEHIEDHISALKEWWRVIKVGGHLVLYLPHKDHYPNIGEEGANPDHKHDFLPKDIISIFKENADCWDLVKSETRSDGDEFSFLQIFTKMPRGYGRKYYYSKSTDRKRCLIVRYGGYGDMLMSATVFSGLKQQGYDITVNTIPRGYDIIKNDPHVDNWIIQDDGQCDMTELNEYWHAISSGYDKFINLSESVEGTFLPVAGSIPHTWPYDVRRKMLGGNYYEFAYDLAGLKYSADDPPDHPPFYPTDRERRIADKRKASIAAGGKKVIMWCLSGSSLHKAWPYTDAVIAEFMIKTNNVSFVLVGDEYCKIMEMGWENEPRVHLKSGKWSIRETLSFAQNADIVVGPQTGVVASVAWSDVQKIIFLSHSSEENLTKYWKNTISLTPSIDRCKCYPCHQLHHGFEHCKRDEKTGAAQCQAAIEPPEVVEAIEMSMLNIKDSA